ncbi:hypothetical protein PENTCL1PPCAC_20621, partial [Pristionchus entomophagus]
SGQKPTFHSLPINAFARICDFSPIKSLLQLRLVSKSLNEHVCVLIKTRKTVVKEFSVKYASDSPYPLKTVAELYLCFLHQRHAIIWHSCLTHAFNKIQLTPLKFSTYLDKNSNYSVSRSFVRLANFLYSGSYNNTQVGGIENSSRVLEA